jgi:cytosine/adenosine deaminase-related metal-dependent hydrolase
MASVHHTDSIFRAAEESGIRASIGKAMMDRENAAGLSESTRTALDASHALRERWHGRGRLQYSYAPRFVPSCTEDLLRETVQEARAHGCLIHTHASENRDELALVRSLTGMDNIVYLHSIGMTGPDVVLAHCIHLTAEEQQILADTGTNVAHCPSSNLKLGSGIAPIPELLHAGVNCTLGSDGAPCNNRMDAFTEMRLAALIQKPRLGPGSLTARTVFDMATCAGAKALGLDTGRLHVGLEADIVAIDPNRIHAFSGGNATGTLVYSATAEMVQHVWIAGEQRVKDRLVHGWSTGETLAECGKALARVRARAGQ